MLYFTVYEHVADFLGLNYVLLAQHCSATTMIVSEATDSHATTKTTKLSTNYPGWVYGTAGGVSTFASQLITAPYSVISSRLQVATTGPNHRLSAIAVLRDVVSRPNGIRALWTGYYSAIAQLGPQHATMWAVSAWLQNQLVVMMSMVASGEDGMEKDAESDEAREDLSRSSSSSSNNKEYAPGLLPRLGTSMCGSFVAIVVTSPMDAVRTHRQIMISHPPPPPPPPSASAAANGIGLVSGGGVGVGGHPITVPSSWSTFVLLYRQQGLRAFTSGILPRALANCPGMIAMMVGYQYVKQLAEYVQRQQDQHDDFK